MERNLLMNSGSLPASPTGPQLAESALSKMKKMIPSPRGKRRNSSLGGSVAVAKIFGVPLDDLVAKDCHETGVPRLVHKMCQYILDNGIISEGIFRVNGNMKTVDKLKTQFDKNGDADLQEVNDVMAVASLLKMFLRELPDSVIPYDMQPAFISAHGLREDKEKHLLALRGLIHKLPQSNYDLLKFLINFLNQITSSSDSNKMTPVALAVVFGPNIFRCSETLQGLKEQACVNAITCKLIEQHSYLFSTDNSNREETSQGGSSTGDTSPRKKPARPPPPRFAQEVSSPRKICEDENSNMLRGGESVPIIGGAENVDNTDSRRVNPLTTSDHRNEIKGRSAVTISILEPNRSASPPKFLRNGSAPVDASPSRKQILDNTIRDAVKKNLFGSNIVNSSSESDTQIFFEHNDAGYLPEDKPRGDSNPSSNIRDMLKSYTARELSKSASLKDRMLMLSESKQMDSNDLFSDSIIDQTALDQMKDDWSGTLRSLTSNRAPPPRRKRGRLPERKVQSEDVDQLIKTRSNELVINDIYKQKIMAKTENPLLVRVKNERVAISLDNIGPDSMRESTPKKTAHTLPNIVSSKSELDKEVRANEEIDSRPIIPPLELFKIEQTDNEDQLTRISSKERFSNILSDGPIRSPRNFQSDDQSGSHHDHKQQIFLEKRQDTVPILDMSAKDLKKRIDSLKKIIANFEASFEAQHQRPPKPSEKSHLNKYIAELGRTRKQLRELQTSMKDNPDQSTQDVGFAPNLRDVKVRTKEPNKEDTLNALSKRLNDKRSAAGRPDELEMMSIDQLKDEKLAVQKALLQYENLHGRPNAKEDKALMRPIYERYRRIKKLIASIEGKEIKNKTEGGGDDQRSEHLTKDPSPRVEVEVPSNEPAEDYSPSSVETPKVNTVNDDELNDTFNITRKPPDLGEGFSTELENSALIDDSMNGTQMATTMSEAVLHGASLEELLKQQKLAKKTKKSIGKLLKDFEDEFLMDTGRKVQKENRGPLESEYKEYKQLKARLRLLDVLITKKKGNPSV